MKLSQEQVRFFRSTGYLKLESRIPEEDLAGMKEVIFRNIRNRVKPFTCDNQGRVVKIYNVIEREPIFMKVFTSDIILDPLESLLGPNIEMLQNRHNHASLTLRDTAPSRLHRDVLQWSRSIVTVIVYLEETTLENGCTHIIPASHYLPFVGTPNNGGTWMDEHSVYFDLLNQSLPVPMPRGGILLFDGLIFHSAGINRTDSTRMSVTMAYHSVDELCKADMNYHQILVRGERIYKGNDS